MGILDSFVSVFDTTFSTDKGSQSLKIGRMKESDTVKGANCKIPHEPGIYRHVDRKTKEVVYVGNSLDVRTRQQQHARSGKLDLEKQFVAYSTDQDLTKEDLRQIETEHVIRHEPEGNIYRGGNGR